MKFKLKLPKQKLIQILAPVVVVLVILALFGAYYFINSMSAGSAQASSPDNQQPEAGLVTCEDLGCPEGSQFIASSESNVYHECSSPYAQAILPQNRICFYNSSEAEQAGYRPAAR